MTTFSSSDSTDNVRGPRTTAKTKQRSPDVRGVRPGLLSSSTQLQLVGPLLGSLPLTESTGVLIRSERARPRGPRRRLTRRLRRSRILVNVGRSRFHCWIVVILSGRLPITLIRTALLDAVKITHAAAACLSAAGIGVGRMIAHGTVWFRKMKNRAVENESLMRQPGRYERLVTSRVHAMNAS